MDITKGLNRIFIIPAAIAMIPAFTAGSAVYKELLRTTVYGKSLELTSYPPDWQCTLAGAAAALIAFLMLLAGFRGFMRFTSRIIGKLKGRSRKYSDYPNWS
jgi:hypothetical protein